LAEPARIDVDEVNRRMDAGEPMVLIDVRGSRDWAKSDTRLPGALRIPYKELEQHLDELPRDRLIVTYCT